MRDKTSVAVRQRAKAKSDPTEFRYHSELCVLCGQFILGCGLPRWRIGAVLSQTN
jgi:hypothetical protein